MDLDDLSPDQRAKFEKFRNSYEWSMVWLADAGGDQELKERDAWEAANRDVPVNAGEEDLFRRMLRDAGTSPSRTLPHLGRATELLKEAKAVHEAEMRGELTIQEGASIATELVDQALEESKLGVEEMKRNLEKLKD